MKIICEHCEDKGKPAIVNLDDKGNGECKLCNSTYIEYKIKVKENKPDNSIYLLGYGALIIISIASCQWLVTIIQKILGR